MKAHQVSDKCVMIDIDNIIKTKLNPIHQNLKNFQPFNSLLKELPEQIMACNFIREDDCVLELGGSIGRNSCVINTILKNKNNHLVIEPNIIEADKLKKNRDNNNLGFNIEICAISDIPLYSRGWLTHTTQVPRSIPVKTLTYKEIKNKYNQNFNVLVIDNEGNFVKMLKSFPDILNNIKLILIEHDFNSVEDLNYFNDVMKNNKFELTGKYLKNEKYGPGMAWGDGVIGDPIFVSAWTR